MTEMKHTKAWLLAGLLFVLLCSHLPMMYTLFYHDLTAAPTAEGGSMDVKGVSTAKDIILDGNWAFYWNRLIAGESEQAGNADSLIRVPDCWSKYKIAGTYLTANGCASYRLTLRGLEASRPVTVYMPDFGSAYRVFIDGELAAESGVVSGDAGEVYTTTKAKLHPVTLSDKPEHIVVIEVATTRFSGLYMVPVLKEYDRAIQDDSNRNTVRLILFGMALFSFFVLIVTYCLSFQKGKRSFWLPVMGLLILLRIMLTTEFYSFWQNTVFFHLSYEAADPLMFLVSFAFKYLLIYLIESLLGIKFSRKEKLLFLLYYVALFLVYLFVPTGFYDRHLTIALPAAAFAIEIYAFFKVWFNRRRLKKYGLLIYWGTVLAILGLIVDCYYINGNSYLNMSLALLISFSAFMMILSVVAALRTADLRSELALSSFRLVLARKQIAMQADYYDALSAQINEVRAVRHDMHHFVGVMKRLSGEGRFGELDRFLSDYADKNEAEPLPVFCEDVVVNSILGSFNGNSAFVGTSSVTREQACLYAFNTLTANVVQYNSKGTTITINGVAIVTGASSASPKDAGTNSYKGATATTYTQFCEEHFSDLTWVSATTGNGELGHKWTFGSPVKDISGIFTDSKVLGTYTGSVTGGTLYSAYTWNTTAMYDLDNNSTNETAVVVSVNGATPTAFSTTNITKGNTTKLFTGYNGATIKLIDTNNDGKVDRVNVTMTYLAKVTSVKAATSTTDRYVVLTVYGLNTGVAGYNATGSTANVDVYTTSFAKDDYVLIAPAGNIVTASTFLDSTKSTDILALQAAEKTTASVASFNSTKSTFVVNGVTYSYSSAATTANQVSIASLSTTATYDMITDANGTVIYLSTNSDTSVQTYAYLKALTAKDNSETLLTGASATFKVKLVYMDGTSAVADYAVKKVTSATLATVNAAGYATDGTTVKSNFAVDDYYITVKDGSGVAKYCAIPSTETTTSISGLTLGALYAVSKSSDGLVTLSAKMASGDTNATTGYLKTQAAVSGANAVAADSLAFTKNTASIALSVDDPADTDTTASTIDSTMYATADTTLTVVSGTTVTSITGYANFATKTYTVGANSVTAIAYVKNSANVVSSILVIGGTAAVTTFQNYGVYLGTGDYTSDGQYYDFFVGGAVVSYLMSDDNATAPSTSGTVYGINLDTKGKAVVTSASTTLATDLSVIGSGYIVGTTGGNSVLYYVADNAQIYDTTSMSNNGTALNTATATNAASCSAVSFVKGDNVIFVTETVNNVANTIVAAFIVNHS